MHPKSEWWVERNSLNVASHASLYCIHMYKQISSKKTCCIWSSLTRYSVERVEWLKTQLVEESGNNSLIDLWEKITFWTSSAIASARPEVLYIAFYHWCTIYPVIYLPKPRVIGHRLHDRTKRRHCEIILLDPQLCTQQRCLKERLTKRSLIILTIFNFYVKKGVEKRRGKWQPFEE